MKYRGGQRGVNDANWEAMFLEPVRQGLRKDVDYANGRDKTKYDIGRRFNWSMVSVVRTWISKQRSQASNSVGAYHAAQTVHRRPSTTGAAGGTPKEPPGREPTPGSDGDNQAPTRGAGKRAEMAELRDLAFGRSHMVQKEGNRITYHAWLLPRVPTPSAGGSRTGGAKGKGKGKAKVQAKGTGGSMGEHASCSQPETSGDEDIGESGSRFDSGRENVNGVSNEGDAGSTSGFGGRDGPGISRGGAVGLDVGNSSTSGFATYGPVTADREAVQREDGAGSTTRLGRAGSGTSRGGAVRGDSGAGSASDLARGGPGGSLGGAVGDSASRAGITETTSDQCMDPTDYEGDPGSEVSSDEESPGEKDRSKRGRAPSYNAAKSEKELAESRKRRENHWDLLFESMNSPDEPDVGVESSGGGGGTDIERAKIGTAMLERLDKKLPCPYTYEDCKKYF